MKIKQTLCALALTAITALGINACSSREELPEPQAENFIKCDVHVGAPRSTIRIPYPYGYEIFTYDLDCDGKIDAIGYGPNAEYIAKGYENKTNTSKHTQELTLKMREIATTMSKLNSELAFEIAKDMYAKQQAKKEK